MGQMRDGLVRGSKCDREAGARIGALLGGLSPEDAGTVCRALGGEPVEGKADFSCVLPFPAALAGDAQPLVRRR